MSVALSAGPDFRQIINTATAATHYPIRSSASSRPPRPTGSPTLVAYSSFGPPQRPIPSPYYYRHQTNPANHSRPFSTTHSQRLTQAPMSQERTARLLRFSQERRSPQRRPRLSRQASRRQASHRQASRPPSSAACSTASSTQTACSKLNILLPAN